MLLNEPSTTNYDLNFSIFGFAVRVHPAFFVFPLLLGASYLRDPALNPGVTLLVLATIFFVSILVHELGHTFAFRYYGIPSRIVLYWMGGLAIPDSGGPWSRPTTSLNPYQQIVVSLAGPIFGFLLAMLLIASVYALRGTIEVFWSGPIPHLIPVLPRGFVPDSLDQPVRMVFGIGIFANVFINLLNLAPVYPLDGGQVARQLFVINDPWQGIRNSIYLSIGFAAIVAVFSLAANDRFIGIFFGVMAWSNYTSLQQMGGGGYGGGYGGGKPW